MTFLATFGNIAISQPKRIQIKKIGPVRISKDSATRNRISKNVMEICGGVNSIIDLKGL
jgi:hypothetical protein